MQSLYEKAYNSTHQPRLTRSEVEREKRIFCARKLKVSNCKQAFLLFKFLSSQKISFQKNRYDEMKRSNCFKLILLSSLAGKRNGRRLKALSLMQLDTATTPTQIDFVTRVVFLFAYPIKLRFSHFSPFH